MLDLLQSETTPKAYMFMIVNVMGDQGIDAIYVHVMEQWMMTTWR